MQGVRRLVGGIDDRRDHAGGGASRCCARPCVNRPQDLPWTRLDLAQPIGAMTGRKLAGLTR
jgi:hypothetical protein